MKKQTLKIDSFKSQITKKQIIDSLIAKNLKGGTKCPPPADWQATNFKLEQKNLF